MPPIAATEEAGMTLATRYLTLVTTEAIHLSLTDGNKMLPKFAEKGLIAGKAYIAANVYAVKFVGYSEG